LAPGNYSPESEIFATVKKFPAGGGAHAITPEYKGCRQRQFASAEEPLLRRHGKNQDGQDGQHEACDKREQGVEGMRMEMAISRPPRVQ